MSKGLLQDWCILRKRIFLWGTFSVCSPVGKAEKSKFVLGGSPDSYKTMDSIENLLGFLPTYSVSSYGLMLLPPVVVASLSPSSGALFANRCLTFSLPLRWYLYFLELHSFVGLVVSVIFSCLGVWKVKMLVYLSCEVLHLSFTTIRKCCLNEMEKLNEMVRSQVKFDGPVSSYRKHIYFN